MRCLNCNNTIPDDSSFCPFCGADLSEHLCCGGCGTHLDKDMLFCPKCGAKNTPAKEPTETLLCEVLTSRNEHKATKKRKPSKALVVVAILAVLLIALFVFLFISKEALPSKYVYDVEIDIEEPVELFVDDSFAIPYTKSPASISDDQIEWTISDPSVAEVTGDGVILAHEPGTVVLSVSIGGQLKDSCSVSILKRPVELSIRNKPDEVYVGETYFFFYDVQEGDVSEDEIQWSVSDETLATIGVGGDFHSIAEGAVEVTLSVDGEVKDKCTIKNVPYALSEQSRKGMDNAVRSIIREDLYKIRNNLNSGSLIEELIALYTLYNGYDDKPGYQELLLRYYPGIDQLSDAIQLTPEILFQNIDEYVDKLIVLETKVVNAHYSRDSDGIAPLTRYDKDVQLESLFSITNNDLTSGGWTEEILCQGENVEYPDYTVVCKGDPAIICGYLRYIPPHSTEYGNTVIEHKESYRLDIVFAEPTFSFI